MFYEKASGRRNLRTAAGEGMVTPVRPVVVEYRDGTKETLLPDRHRFDPAHVLVRQRPEVFELCDKRDRTNAPARFREALRVAERELTRPSSTTSRPGRSGLRSGRVSPRNPRARYGRHQLGRRYQ
jgi:hypothetical protein